jgi:thiamine transport system ATP-binding protein
MLQITDLYKAYTPGTLALAGINLTISEGELVCLLGPSGCGKTTLLRAIAGLESIDQGRISLKGQDMVAMPVYKRNFGFMFQEFALFPHRTVGENIAFGLRMAGQAKAAIAERIDEMLDLVNLPGYASRSIFALSGGERQRVALARSLAPNPRLLMLDEPLGSLDRALREGLMTELRIILKRLGMTAIYVTHDQQEAFAIADRVVVMHAGRIEQSGAPAEVYNRPASAFVAAFLGFRNLVPATVRITTPNIAHTTLGTFALPAPSTPGEYTLLIRPQATILATSRLDKMQPVLRVKLLHASFRGDHYQLQVAPEDDHSLLLTFDVPAPRKQAEVQLVEGEDICVVLDTAGMTLLPT